METKLEGFLGIPFGVSITEVKEKMNSRPNSNLDEENSDDDMIIYRGVKFAGRETQYILISFLDNQFCKASVYIKPNLESRVISTYKEIRDELNSKYYVTEKDFETYEYPYEKNDGSTETAISLGKADFSSFWNFAEPGEKDNYISVIIDTDLSIEIVYEHGSLVTEMVERNKKIDSDDY